MFNRIADAVGQELSVVFVDGQVTPQPPDAAGNGNMDDLSVTVNSCPANEMRRRDWLPAWETLDELREHLRRFFGPGPKHVETHRRGSGPDNPNETALTCWATRLEIEAERIDVPRFSARRLKERLPELVRLSPGRDGPVKAVEWLENNGVRCLFIRHLPKTYLDGAAALLDDGSPCIGLTLRHDRLDNFWFTLLHEIGHVLLHRGQLLSRPIPDEEIENKPYEKQEEQADRFARNSWMAPKTWREFRRKNPTFPSSSAVRTFAGRLHVTPALVAGRVRHDLKQYHPYGQFLGANTVRPLIEREYPVF